MSQDQLCALFTSAGLTRNSGCFREYAAGKVIIDHHVNAGACDYDAAIGALVEYLRI
jgi:hypothetical protein